MAHILAANTLAVEPVSGAVRVLLAGEEPPEWAYGQIQSPELWQDGNVPDAVEGASAPTDGTPPPHGGPGSGRAAWLQYARANQVTVADDATREDIVTACQNAGVAVN